MNKMKKVSYLLFLISFLGFNCISCSDDDTIHEEEPVGEVVSVDELEVLQNSLAKVDEKGNLVERVLGVSLDAADPDEVSVGVDSYDEAVEILANYLLILRLCLTTVRWPHLRLRKVKRNLLLHPMLTGR